MGEAREFYSNCKYIKPNDEEKLLTRIAAVAVRNQRNLEREESSERNAERKAMIFHAMAIPSNGIWGNLVLHTQTSKLGTIYKWQLNYLTPLTLTSFVVNIEEWRNLKLVESVVVQMLQH